MMNESKTCSHCGQTKPIEEFRQKRGKVCVSCVKVYRQQWLASNESQEKYCPKCKIRMPKNNFTARHKWCKDCDAKYRTKKLTSEEKILQKTINAEKFQYNRRNYQDGDVITLLQEDEEENKVRSKVFAVQQQIAKHQTKKMPALKQQGNYWIWK